MEEAFLTPICDPSLHCTVLSTSLHSDTNFIALTCIQLWCTDQKLYAFPYVEHCCMLHWCVEKRIALQHCIALYEPVWNPLATQQCRKLKCSLFQKGNSSLSMETCCLALQVNCHILVQLRFFSRRLSKNTTCSPELSRFQVQLEV